MLLFVWYVRNRIWHVHPVSDGNSRCRLGTARHSTNVSCLAGPVCISSYRPTQDEHARFSMSSIAIRLFFGKETKSLWTPRKSVKYLMPSLRRWQIGFDDTIPPDYYTNERFSSIIKRHCNHPSITKIKENNAHNDIFHFQCINPSDFVKMTNDLR